MKEDKNVLTGIETFNMGKWIKFGSRLTAPNSYRRNKEKLYELIKDTNWPEKVTDPSPLEESDIYVFVDNNMKPQIEIRAEHDKYYYNNICAIRGTDPDEYVNPEYENVIKAFVNSKYKEFKNSKDVLDSIEWNKRLIYYIDKIESGNFTKEDVPDFIKNYFKLNTKYSYGTALQPAFENRNRKRLKELMPNIKEQVAEYYNCSVDEILFDNLHTRLLDIKKGETYKIPYKVIFGFLDCKLSNYDCNIDMGNLERVAGDATFEFSPVTSLNHIKEISGNVVLANSIVMSLGDLTVVGGSLIVNGRSFLKSLENVKIVGEDLEIYDSNISDVGSLEYIGGDFNPNRRIVDLKGIIEIGGTASLNCASELKTLGSNLKKIGKDAHMSGKLEDLGVLEYVGGRFDASYTSFKSLGNIKNVGSIYLWGSEVDDLGCLEVVDGDAYLTDIKNFGNLKVIKGKIECGDPETLQRCYEHLGINQEEKDTGKSR